MSFARLFTKYSLQKYFPLDGLSRDYAELLLFMYSEESEDYLALRMPTQSNIVNDLLGYMVQVTRRVY